jgi:hypothetical protein
MARGIRCVAHKHGGVVAEENHHLQPMSRGGLTVMANMRYLCANAHSDTHYLLDLIEKGAVPLIGTSAKPDDAINTIPWSIARTYGPGIRDAAFTGWARYADAFLRGDYRRHFALWLTSGHARTLAAGAPRWLPGPPPSYAEAERMDVVDNWLGAVDRGLAKGLAL